MKAYRALARLLALRRRGRDVEPHCFPGTIVASKLNCLGDRPIIALLPFFQHHDPLSQLGEDG